jgi:SAM-dependent methyltransferase
MPEFPPPELPASAAADAGNRQASARAVRDATMLFPDEQVVRFLARNGPYPVDARGLDIGCGSGRHTLTLAEFGLRAIGIDYEPEVVRAAAEAFGTSVSGLRFEVGDLAELPGRAERFDVVIAWGVVFLRERTRMVADLRALFEAMNPGGRLLVDVHPSADCRHGKGTPLGGGTWRLDERAGVYAGMLFTFLEPDEARAMLEAVGFEVYEEERVEYWKKGRDRFVWSVFYARKPANPSGAT